MKKAAAYIRVSTDEQTEFSPDSQLKAIRSYAQSHGFELPEEYVFVDEGISGRRAEKRPAFQKMIGTAKLRPKPFDAILLWKFSRFARNREDSIVYKSMLRKQCGIDVVSVSEQLSEDKTSVLIEALIEAMDEYYSLNLAEEVRRGMQEKFSRGGVVSQPPFGYRMEDGGFVPDGERADIVRGIFSDYLGGKSFRQIAAALNEAGECTSKGNPFENRTVEYILTNPVYTGKLRRSLNGRDSSDRFHEQCGNTLLVDGGHEPLVTQETFDRVQEKRLRCKELYSRASRHEPADFMLRGLVRCSECGATLTRQSSGNSLQCHNYAKGRCKVSHSARIEKLNEAVIGQLISDLGSGEAVIDIRPETSPEVPKVPVAAMLERERRKLVRVREAYEAGVDTLAEYRKNKERISQRIAELERQLEVEPQVSSSRPAGRVSTAVTLLESPDISENAKNTALRSIIAGIVLVRPGDTVEITYREL